MSWGLAVDFGTTATAAAMCDADGNVTPLTTFDGKQAIPSSVFAEGRELVVGEAADNAAQYELSCYEPTPKRHIGRATVMLGPHNEFRPAELIGAVLKVVFEEALDQQDRRSPSALVLTHPAKWTATRRKVLAEAATYAAGELKEQFPDPIFVAEPVAAAHWFARQPGPLQGGDYFAVYDLGGGTFDTAVLQRRGADYRVVASGGIDPLGGFDFTSLLFDYLGETRIAPIDPALWAAMSDPQPRERSGRDGRRRLSTAAELIKIGLSTLPEKRTQLPGLTKQVTVTREELDGLIAELIESSVDEMEATMARAGLHTGELAAIYRIGGAARTPLVARALARLELPVRAQDHPKLVVAQGAATIAHRAMSAQHPSPLLDETLDEGACDDAPTEDNDHAAQDDESPATISPLLNLTSKALLGTAGAAALSNALDAWRRKQAAAAASTPAGSNPALDLALANAGVDPKTAHRSHLELRQDKVDARCTMLLQRARMTVDGQFCITADRSRKGPRLNLTTSNFNTCVRASQDDSREQGWTLHPSGVIALAGIEPGLAQWRTRTVGGAEQRQLLCFAQRGPYFIDAWFDATRADLRESIRLSVPAGTSSFTSRFAASTAVTFAVPDIDPDLVEESIDAEVTMRGVRAEITAELSPNGATTSTIADKLMAHPGVGRTLVKDEADRFFGGTQCRASRFEWHLDRPAGSVGDSPTATTWMWTGDLAGRLATVIVESSNPGAPAAAFRDLVRLTDAS